ncbi:MAG TPA: hypothetical protein VGC19_15385 [Rhodanobacter sp.]
MVRDIFRLATLRFRRHRYGEYTYYPATDPSFNLPLAVGRYDFTLAACNSIDCSATVSGGPLHLTDPSAVQTRVRSAMKAGASVVGMDPAAEAGGGCNATSCAATVGDQP